jgi:response regulator RpfG family c-di-GMP phosphodiesterase
METTENLDQVRNCLIIEDSSFDQRMMERVVHKTGSQFHVEVVSTLCDARRVLAEGPVSIILLDNNLPDGKGANFALELSKDKELSRIPVIIVSDWPSPFMWQKAQLAGVSSVVNKSEFCADLITAALPREDVMH